MAAIPRRLPSRRIVPRLMPPSVDSPLLSFVPAAMRRCPGWSTRWWRRTARSGRTGRRCWRRSAALGPGELQHRFATADRYLREAGVFYRIYGEAGGSERPLELAHMPLVLPSEEWRRITDGLIERAEVLETVLRDLYGARQLVADGALPAALVTGSARIPSPDDRRAAAGGAASVVVRGGPRSRAGRPLVGARGPDAGAVGRRLRAREPGGAVARLSRHLQAAQRRAAGRVLRGLPRRPRRPHPLRQRPRSAC